MTSTGQHFLVNEILKVANTARLLSAVLGKAAPRGARAASPVRRLLSNPNFQQVMESSQSGFRKMPGLPVTSPYAQQAILRPYEMGGQYAAMSNIVPSSALPGQLRMNRQPMARAVRGFRDLQRRGIM